MSIFWRVDYEGEMDKSFMVEQGRLGWPRNLSLEDRQKFGKQMRVGHGIVLAKIRGKIARLEGIGRITAIETHPIKGYEVAIELKSFDLIELSPDDRGVKKWQKYPVFKFVAATSAQYGFDDLLAEHFPEEEDEE